MDTTNVCLALTSILLAMNVRKTEPAKDVAKYVNSGFVKVLEECKNELKLTDNIFADLFHFWKLEYDLVNRDTGCVIICMSKKLELIDRDGKLHHGNAQQFAMTHGAGEGMASKLVSSLHECEKQYEGTADECVRVLEIAKCFRTNVHDLQWTPKVEYIVDEVLTEV